jgi:hypothetical protein
MKRKSIPIMCCELASYLGHWQEVGILSEARKASADLLKHTGRICRFNLHQRPFLDCNNACAQDALTPWREALVKSVVSFRSALSRSLQRSTGPLIDSK